MLPDTMTDAGLRLSPEQNAELHAAEKAVEGITPGALSEITGVFARDPQMLRNSAQGLTEMTVKAVFAAREARAREIEPTQSARPETTRVAVAATPASDIVSPSRVVIESEKITRLARAMVDRNLMTDRGLRLSSEQSSELRAAEKAVEGIRPGALSEVTGVFLREPQLLQNSAQGLTEMTVRAVFAAREARAQEIEQAGLSKPETMGAKPAAIPTSDPASQLNDSLDSRMIARLARATIELRKAQYNVERLQPEQDEERRAAFDAVNRTDPGVAWVITRAFDRDPQRLLDAAQGQTASTVAAVIAERNQRTPDNEQYRVPLPERQRDWGL